MTKGIKVAQMLSDIGYGATNLSPTAALPLGEESINLADFEIGSNFTLGEAPKLQLSPSDIIDVTPLFWSGQPNAFWFKTHDDRDFQQSVEVENDENSLTLDTVEVTQRQTSDFTKAMQTQSGKLKVYIVSELAPFYLSFKNAVWTAQQELRQLTNDPELEIQDLGTSYDMFLRKALRYKLAEFVCDELEIPESFLQDLLGKEPTSAPENVLRKMLQQVVQDIGGTNVKSANKGKT